MGYMCGGWRVWMKCVSDFTSSVGKSTCIVSSSENQQIYEAGTMIPSFSDASTLRAILSESHGYGRMRMIGNMQFLIYTRYNNNKDTKFAYDIAPGLILLKGLCNICSLFSVTSKFQYVRLYLQTNTKSTILSLFVEDNNATVLKHITMRNLRKALAGFDP